MKVLSTQEATGPANASIVASGGLGVASKAFFGGDVRTLSTTQATSTVSGALRVDGGAGVAGNIWLGGKLVIKQDQPESEVSAVIGQTTLDPTVNGTPSTTAYNILALRDPTRTWYFGTDGADNTQLYLGCQSTPAENPDYMYYFDSSGRFALNGLVTGASPVPNAGVLFTVRGNSTMTGSVSVANVTDSTTGDGTTGALRTTGGASIAKSMRVGGTAVVNGGLGVAGNISANNVSDSTTSDGMTGSLRTLGGASIAKDMRVGQQTISPQFNTGTAGNFISVQDSGVRYFGALSRAMKIQVGYATSSTAPVTVTFANAFPGGGVGEVPVVQATLFSATNLTNDHYVQIYSVTATEFSFAVRHSNAFETGVQISWTAFSNAL
jgi:hypothetical protein